MKITVLRERSTKTFTVTLGEADTTSTSDNSSNQQKTPIKIADYEIKSIIESTALHSELWLAVFFVFWSIPA